MNPQHLRLAALIGAAMALACPLQARAAADDLVIRTMGPVSYVCGGVAEDERQALAAREKDFNIGILFTQGAAGEFLSELAGGGFWGFSGYLISRGECVIHAKVTSIDN